MRITGGIHRSRTLVAPAGTGTRPTSDRVREALFSMLVANGLFELPGGPTVLDLYAGSGALGLEAISRGAASAVLVESARPALAAIRTNVEALEAAHLVTVLSRRVEQALSDPLLEERGPYGLILLDPPYADVRAPRFATILEGAARLLAAHGILVLEHDASDVVSAPTSLSLDRTRRHGDTSLSLFLRDLG